MGISAVLVSLECPTCGHDFLVLLRFPAKNRVVCPTCGETDEIEIPGEAN